MVANTLIRPGGRSARIQSAVHKAVVELQKELPREALNFPAIAERSGVTPSTLYRRWGNLTELLADVELERMRADEAPEDTGSLYGDLLAWCEQYYEEMSSQPGRCMLRDVIASSDDERRRCCARITREQMEALIERAVKRGESVPSVDLLMERLIAPLVYYLLYDIDFINKKRINGWVEQVF